MPTEAETAIRSGQAPGGAPLTGLTARDEPPLRKKQKRNKPTLSCWECVERKTKVWRPCIVFIFSLTSMPVR